MSNLKAAIEFEDRPRLPEERNAHLTFYVQETNAEAAMLRKKELAEKPMRWSLLVIAHYFGEIA